MRKNNKRDNAKKERAIMVASAVFVLSALTLTGIYMKAVNREEQDDGYMIDFTALEDNVDEKLNQIAQNDQEDDGIGLQYPFGIEPNEFNTIIGSESGLEFMPIEEAGSGLVEIPGLTDGGTIKGEVSSPEETPSQGGVILPKETTAPPAATQKPAVSEEPKQEKTAQKQEKVEQDNSGQNNDQQAKTESEKEQQDKVKPTEGAVVARTLHFTENEGLLRPVNGEILMPYSMDRSIYFSTMRDYRYNPALVLEAETGTRISACASGKVVSIFSNEEIGHAITMDLGNGYQITYGQLEGINVTLNSYVDKGDMIASVAAPTKYYCVEGSNLYLKMTKDGKPVDPEPLFQ